MVNGWIAGARVCRFPNVVFNRFPFQALTSVAGNGCVARPDAGCRADWMMMAGRAWFNRGAGDPRAAARGYRLQSAARADSCNASVGCDGGSGVCRVSSTLGLPSGGQGGSSVGPGPDLRAVARLRRALPMCSMDGLPGRGYVVSQMSCSTDSRSRPGRRLRAMVVSPARMRIAGLIG